MTMPYSGHVAKDRCVFRAALIGLQARASELGSKFDSSDPHVIEVPNIMFTHEPSMQQVPSQASTSHGSTGEALEPGTVEAITRPQELRCLYKLLGKQLDIQMRPQAYAPGIIVRHGGARCTRAIFLRGCKGVGKSYLMLLTAVQLLVKERGARVVYIGDCGALKRCADQTQMEDFLAEAFASAFANDPGALQIIDRWKADRHSLNYHWGTFLGSLLCEIKSYCSDNGLVVAVFIDKADELANDGNNMEILNMVWHISRASQFAVVLAASDECIAGDISAEVNAFDYPVEQPFSSAEASLYVRRRCPSLRIGAWHLKEILNATWRHPSDLRHLCGSIEKAARLLADGNKNATSEDGHSYDEIIANCTEEFRKTPNTDFVPTPFASLAWASSMGSLPDMIWQSILDVLQMRGLSYEFLVDRNYMKLSSASACRYIYPSLRVATGLVHLHCAGSEQKLPANLEHHLENMRLATYRAS